MKTKNLSTALASVAVALALGSCNMEAPREAAAPTTVRVNQLVADWERAKNYTQAYLDSADDQTISYKLSDKTPRTFGAQLLHLAEGNYGLIKAGGGKPTDMGWGSLEKKPEYATKADVTNAVMASYDYVIASLKDLNDTQLMDTVKTELWPGFNVSITKEAFFNKTFEHQTHHRGQCAQYLRAQGKRPPEEMLF